VIPGGLATGAAVGAGIVAGEALAHRLTDVHAPAPLASPPPELAIGPSDDNLGGNDFGVSGDSSWDDAGGGGDWS